MALVLAVLIAVARVVKFWPLIVGVIGAIVAAYWGRRFADRHAERVEAERRRLAGIVARADQQHAWVLAGDPRGTYVDEIARAKPLFNHYHTPDRTAKGHFALDF
jgi:hypothetical protein